MTNEKTPPTKNHPPATDAKERAKLRAKMAEICENLKDELENPDPYSTALERQVILLDRLLYAVMRRSMRDDIHNGDFNPDHLNKILRIQKQSMDAYKAVYTIEYMQQIMEKLQRAGYTPSPLLHHKQTEEPWIREE